MCNSKILKFLKEQKARGLLSTPAVKTPLTQIPLLGPFLFQKYKMNEIMNKFLLARNKFMP